MPIVETSKSEDLKRLRESCDAVKARAANALSPLSDAQLNWRPGPDRWSAGECALHVHDVNASYHPGLTGLVQQGRECVFG